MADFDKTGLGIGGAGRHDLDAEAAELAARGEMPTIRRRIRKPRGQLWQPCFCGTEPVCLNCERCFRHCIC